MNRKFLLDSLDGMKSLVLDLIDPAIKANIGSIPMTTDGPWNNSEMKIYEKIVGIPHERTYWKIGNFLNVPLAGNPAERNSWLRSVASLKEKYIWLDPDTGFYNHHTSSSDKMLLVNELLCLASRKEALIVYRHQYWPNPKPEEIPDPVIPYVWHGLTLLQDAGLKCFAYQSQSASFFFVSNTQEKLQVLWECLYSSMRGVDVSVIDRRLVKIEDLGSEGKWGKGVRSQNLTEIWDQ